MCDKCGCGENLIMLSKEPMDSPAWTCCWSSQSPALSPPPASEVDLPDGAVILLREWGECPVSGEGGPACLEGAVRPATS